MKKPMLLAIIAIFSLVSCENSDLELLEDPNDITLDKADLNRFTNQIQLDFASFMRQMGSNAAEASRVEYMTGRNYNNAFQPAILDGEWLLAYQNMFSDISAAQKIAEEKEENKHLGVMKILKAYTLITLVDHFGDVPFSQIADLGEYTSPIADPGTEVYEGAIALLDESIDHLNATGTNLENDFYYNNDFNKWKKLANTIKMQAYLTTRLVDGSALGKFATIANSPGSFISSSADDFVFQYGSNDSNPDTRHPEYSRNYTSNGVIGYRSNWLMHTMLQNDDPRRRFYFYRQVDCTPGTDGCPPNTLRLPCSVVPVPPHFSAGMIFCSVGEGYWGRDHGNSEGLPQDGLQKTAAGVYPYAGRFDGDEFAAVSEGIGGGGAGILPIMLASYTDLMRAEFSLAQNNTGAATNALRSALQKSTEKVVGFASVDPEANTALIPSASTINNFITRVVNEFSSADANGKWEILGNQTLIANYGSGNLGYNFYRRTGFPFRGINPTHALQFNIETNPGSFIRSFLYPSVEANVNSNITQKPNVSVQVFWDNNPPSPSFPAAN
ncbi:SusD/RagB family nutrient-binding outer membrane lipoprotein [Aureisphaera galaxeae]|uniref:SusD/RagB family nutrient-binding outer membrane lipoprotein n=1 Tax=Aureisphaera galaxeae TaxID=1538023 RepID=UPI0023508DDB|nr:SusD/RagB family nutrient-binding outer membrane lipoprotein [Aureisphaera galaxeae]MDC8006268.1 SusD/RagB family nutrient-binding outer membrane lipoprotein [Aureisphaera galaxeae]